MKLVSGLLASAVAGAALFALPALAHHSFPATYLVDKETKIEGELGWRPRESFESGLRKTVHWYLDNQDWVRGVATGEYRRWVERQYEEKY